MSTTNDNNTATFLHLSALSQYVIPFGNFILPIIIWSSSKDKSAYVDRQGKEAINFQLSLFLYSILLVLIAVPIFIIVLAKGLSASDLNNDGDFILQNFDFENMSSIIVISIIACLLFVFLKIAEFFLIIYAAVRTSSGEDFRYPITIRFLK